MKQLDLLRARAADTDLTTRYKQRVIDLLGDGAWHLRRQICRQFPELTERACRQIAENSKGEILSGQMGYKLTRFATNEEIDHAERWLLSQSAKMKDRALEIRRARNHGGAAA